MLRIPSLLFLAVFLSACASIPESLRGDYPPLPTVDTVRAQPQAYIGQEVRWGGVIIGVENLSERSVLEILAYPLDKSARPKIDESSLGRFLLHVQGFVDPATYLQKREVSAVGRIKAVETRKIGEYAYHYPVLEARALHLWPERQEPEPEYYYDPWYPWYPYPWYGPYRYHP
jgi:outer membrane lipoprotein